VKKLNDAIYKTDELATDVDFWLHEAHFGTGLTTSLKAHGGTKLSDLDFLCGAGQAETLAALCGNALKAKSFADAVKGIDRAGVGSRRAAALEARERDNEAKARAAAEAADWTSSFVPSLGLW